MRRERAPACSIEMPSQGIERSLTSVDLPEPSRRSLTDRAPTGTARSLLKVWPARPFTRSPLRSTGLRVVVSGSLVRPAFGGGERLLVRQHLGERRKPRPSPPSAGAGTCRRCSRRTDRFPRRAPPRHGVAEVATALSCRAAAVVRWSGDRGFGQDVQSPTSRLPICVARRMRCASLRTFSPRRAERQVPSPTSRKTASLADLLGWGPRSPTEGRWRGRYCLPRPPRSWASSEELGGGGDDRSPPRSGTCRRSAPRRDAAFSRLPCPRALTVECTLELAGKPDSDSSLSRRSTFATTPSQVLVWPLNVPVRVVGETDLPLAGPEDPWRASGGDLARVLSAGIERLRHPTMTERRGARKAPPAGSLSGSTRSSRRSQVRGRLCECRDATLLARTVGELNRMPGSSSRGSFPPRARVALAEDIHTGVSPLRFSMTSTTHAVRSAVSTESARAVAVLARITIGPHHRDVVVLVPAGDGARYFLLSRPPWRARSLPWGLVEKLANSPLRRRTTSRVFDAHILTGV